MQQTFLAARWQRRDFIAAALGAAALGVSGAAAATATPATPMVLVLGDSLSAEYGLQRGQGWVALLQQRLEAQKISAKVVNASISGDTTSGGRARLPQLLAQQHPTLVVIELGGNDALRGLALAQTRDNLNAMVLAAQQVGAKVLLLGMQVPPNYGASYTNEFADIFASVAQARHVALVPFLLRGVADRGDAADWFQPDRIHPLAKAHPILLDNVWPKLKPLLA